WDLGDARRFGRPFHYQTASIAFGPLGPSEPPLSVAPDGRTFAVDTSSDTVGLFSLGDLTPRRTIRVTGGGDAVAWSPTGEPVIGGPQGKLELIGAPERRCGGLGAPEGAAGGGGAVGG